MRETIVCIGQIGKKPYRFPQTEVLVSSYEEICCYLSQHMIFYLYTLPDDDLLVYMKEELGLDLPPESLRFLFTEPFSYVLDDYYLAFAEVDPATLTLETEEVAEARWFSLEEVKASMAEGRFVDYPLPGIERVFRIAAEG